MGDARSRNVADRRDSPASFLSFCPDLIGVRRDPRTSVQVRGARVSRGRLGVAAWLRDDGDREPRGRGDDLPTQSGTVLIDTGRQRTGRAGVEPARLDALGSADPRRGRGLAPVRSGAGRGDRDRQDAVPFSASRRLMRSRRSRSDPSPSRAACRRPPEHERVLPHPLDPQHARSLVDHSDRVRSRSSSLKSSSRMLRMCSTSSP